MDILIADDSRTILALTYHVLEQLGHTVQTVRDGDEVITLLWALPPPDLLITDYNMPRMDGLEVLRRIRANDRFKLLRVIVYTTNDYPEFKATVEALGGVLVNPKTASNLLAAVDAIATSLQLKTG